MAGKRAASTDLNHDNWDDEEKPEEAGTFKKASDDVLEKRVVKKAKRRLQNSEDGTRSVFGTFTGFKTKTTTSASPFSFLANNNTNISANDMASKTVTNVEKSSNNETPKTNENGTNKREENTEIQTSSTMFTSKNSTSDQEEQNIFKKSTDYFAKLKGLNESVAQWIKTHVDANPFCILTPIFKDYERYLKEIEDKHGSEIEKSTQAQCNDNNEIANTDKKIESSPFGRTHAKSPLKSAEWKPKKSIFGNINLVSKSISKKSKHTVNAGKPIFSTGQNSHSPKSVFDSIDKKSGSKSIFGSTSTEKNPFLSKPPTASDKSEEQETKSDSKPTTTIVTNTTITSSFATTNTTTFCFGQSYATSNTSTGFSFGSTKPFTFGAQVVQPQEPEDEGKDDENEEPPKADFKPVTEEGAIYEQRCKVFVKKDGNFTDRGIGTLFLKPTPNEKTQLLVRAETSLGNLLLNTLLTESIPTKRMNKNTIMLVCLPMPESTPPPVPVLLRVKTDEDADVLLETLNKHKK